MYLTHDNVGHPYVQGQAAAIEKFMTPWTSRFEARYVPHGMKADYTTCCIWKFAYHTRGQDKLADKSPQASWTVLLYHTSSQDDPKISVVIGAARGVRLRMISIDGQCRSTKECRGSKGERKRP